MKLKTLPRNTLTDIPFYHTQVSHNRKFHVPGSDSFCTMFYSFWQLNLTSKNLSNSIKTTKYLVRCFFQKNRLEDFRRCYRSIGVAKKNNKPFSFLPRLSILLLLSYLFLKWELKIILNIVIGNCSSSILNHKSFLKILIESWLKTQQKVGKL